MSKYKKNNSEVSKKIEGKQVSFNDVDGSRTTKWLESHFPISLYGRVDWNSVQSKRIIAEHSREEIAKLIIATINQVNETYFIVFWDDTSINPLKIDKDDLINHITDILIESFDVWIIPDSNNGRWCIEVYHEGEFCYGTT